MILASVMFMAISILFAIKVFELDHRVQELEDKKVDNEILNGTYEYDDSEEWIDIDNFEIEFNKEKQK